MAQENNEIETQSDAMKALKEKIEANIETVPNTDYKSQWFKDKEVLQQLELKSVEQFNNKFFVVRHLFGKARVCWLKHSKNPRTGITTRDLQHKDRKDFIEAYIDKRDSVGDALAPKWFIDKDTRRFDDVVFKDPAKVQPNEFNMYSGFSVAPQEGDIKPYKQFISEIVCQGNEELEEYWYNLAAYGIQNPFENWKVYVICYSSEEGTGKDTFVDMYGDIFCDYFIAQKADRIVGKFNDQIAFKPVVKLEEGEIEPRLLPTLRGTVTSPKLDVEIKRQRGGNIDNIIKLFITTNSDGAVRVSQTDRRALCLEFSKKRMGDKKYFKDLQHWYYQEGGINKVLNFFQKRQLEGFAPTSRPVTALLSRMKDKSLPGYKKAILELLEDGAYVAQKNKHGIEVRQMSTGEFRERYDKLYPDIRAVSDNVITDVLKALEFTKKATSMGNVWLFPDLKQARATWNDKFAPRNWNSISAWYTPGEAPQLSVVVDNEAQVECADVEY